nr:hypothetical protein [Desulfobulbaceae bacterium]
MCQENTEIMIRGNEGEDRLNSWFQENGLTYFPVKQDIKSFLHTFAKTMKRPDFFLLLEGISMIAVDAKNYSLSCGYFTLNKDELYRALSYEIITKMPFWFAYLHQHEGGSTWYWISALKALDAGVTRLNSQTKEEFLAISLNDFISVRNHEDISKLYTNRCRLNAKIVPIRDN